MGERMFFRGAYLSVLSLRACIRLGSIFLFFPAFGSRSQVRHLIALLFLVPPAAKEGKGDCEFPLCPPWILLLPLCNAGHCVPRGGYGGGIRSIELSISGGRFYDAAIDMVALLPCLDHAQTALNLCRFLCVEHTHTEPQGLIIAPAPTLIYGGRGMDGCSYIQYRVRTASFRARHTFRRA